jgi:hypothetical protein
VVPYAKLLPDSGSAAFSVFDVIHRCDLDDLLLYNMLIQKKFGGPVVLLCLVVSPTLPATSPPDELG